jgi:hypothetical protein
MSKPPTASQARVAGKKKTSSACLADRTNRARSRSPIRRDPAAVGTAARDTGKDNGNVRATFDDTSSDISSDETEQGQSSATLSDEKRRSPVYDFAVKMSVNEYQCKLCSKVRHSVASSYVRPCSYMMVVLKIAATLIS